jgi:energy-coupling factor transporter ATP-binding protein EcfA2
MQLKRFNVHGLFGTMNHIIPFPVASEGQGPSMVILYGRNGVGKTTILRMLDGAMHLDFNIFRSIPFSKCSIEFDTGGVLSITPVKRKTLKGLDVTFRNMTVRLHPEHSGPLLEKDIGAIEKFREFFLSRTEDINYELIDTARLQERFPKEPTTVETEDVFEGRIVDRVTARRLRANPKAIERRQAVSITSKVARFILNAQVNYTTFFSTTEPEVFPRIIERLTSRVEKKFKPEDLRDRIERIHNQDKVNTRLGLEADRWDFDQLAAQLKRLSRQSGIVQQQALTVLDAYVEVLESRAAERALIAERLLTFERLVSEFFIDKKISVHPKEGIVIMTDRGIKLKERQLSSGEFHFLFLMVSALVAQRRGTVIAIDEPEMSMHIEWQRKLVRALTECASGAEPLFIFATHSPDLAASYPNALIKLEDNTVG